MRLEPIEKPRGLMSRIAYYMGKRQFGKVPAAFKVIYARSPKLGMASYQIARTMEKGLSLDPELVLLVATLTSMRNGCSFCADLHLAQAVQEKLSLRKFKALQEFRTSLLFSDEERAALAYVEEVTETKDVSDATFADLQKNYDERQVVELVWLTAVGNYFNLMAVPLQIESDDLTSLALAKAS